MWQIKDVSRMTGVPVDDIQRICHKGDEKCFIFCPSDSRPGRRYFDEADMLRILLVGQYKKMGYNLREIQQAFKKHNAEEKTDFESILANQIENLREKQQKIDEQIHFAEELKMALKDAGPQEAASALLRKRTVETFFDSLTEELDDLGVSITDSELERRFIDFVGIGKERLLNALLTQDDLEDERNDGLETKLKGMPADTLGRLEDGELPSPQQLVSFLSEFVKMNSTPETEKTAKQFIWLLFVKMLDQPHFELFVEITFGKGFHKQLSTALFDYAGTHWGNDAASDKQ